MWYFNLKRSLLHVSRGYHFVPPTTDVVEGSVPPLIEAGEYFYLCSTHELLYQCMSFDKLIVPDAVHVFIFDDKIVADIQGCCVGVAVFICVHP